VRVVPTGEGPDEAVGIPPHPAEPGHPERRGFEPDVHQRSARSGRPATIAGWGESLATRISSFQSRLGPVSGAMTIVSPS
jgi:hypothetical protein